MSSSKPGGRKFWEGRLFQVSSRFPLPFLPCWSHSSLCTSLWYFHIIQWHLIKHLQKIRATWDMTKVSVYRWYAPYPSLTLSFSCDWSVWAAFNYCIFRCCVLVWYQCKSCWSFWSILCWTLSCSPEVPFNLSINESVLGLVFLHIYR
jgi:hypothetical protein